MFAPVVKGEKQILTDMGYLPCECTRKKPAVFKLGTFNVVRDNEKEEAN